MKPRETSPMEGLSPGPEPADQVLRVLVIEDNLPDADLCLHDLKKEGFKISADIAQTQDEFMAFVHSEEYDLVLSDYNLRNWNALDAIRILRDKGKDIPFVLVTGSLGDEAAVECVKQGVSDYVLKDRRARLPVAIKRALREKAERESRRRLEEQLQQSQKMEAIGRLAGGVAHDFNNLLTVIAGYCQLLLDRLGPNDPMRTSVGQIKEAGDRAASLTRQLLAFSRKQVLAPQVLNLNQVVANMNKMLTRLIGEDVELVTICFPGLWRVKADPGQIEQVMMNLAVNARDAMPRGGKLTIETANANLDKNFPDQHFVIIPGSYVMLAVSDTGTGMNQEIRSRIFEPFYTTKELGKGTGLGLSTVYGIVKQSGGYIWVYSEPEKGTTFKVYLPRAEADAEEPKQAESVLRTQAGSETILLVEDNEAVRTFVRCVLEARGYRLLEAGGSEDALKAVERHAGPIHLLLTDVVMPRMSGTELALRIASLHPETKVLYMSGYTDNAIVHHGVLDAGRHFLQKPFIPEALTQKIREVLGE
ncbi:MAG TPA: response regulator [Terriglobia bacterium]|nr:response regulator [Terriglobia bacterium]